MNLLIAIVPILLVLLGITVFKIPAWITSIVSAVITFVLAVTVFDGGTSAMLATTQSGVISALEVSFLVWGAFALLELMQVSTAMNRIKTSVAGITNDKRVQTVLIAFCIGVFIEGATGNGAAGAILGPFLVGLGFAPLTAAAAVLIGNGVPPCFGGAGTPTIAGMSGITDQIALSGLVTMTGRFLAIGMICVPFVLLLVLYGKKSLKGMGGYLITVGICMAISMLLTTQFIGGELADLITGVVGVAVSLVYIKKIGVKHGEEYQGETGVVYESSVSTIKAFAPYILLMIMLPAVRFSFSLTALCKYGYPTWIGAVIHVCVFLGACIMGCAKDFLKCEVNALKKLVQPIIALCSLYALANLMNSSGMISLIAQTLADVAGKTYPAVSVVIGVLGAFITGSCLGSNRLFAGLHLQATTALGINNFVSITASSAGASLGNMICPNNIIAVNATLELKKSEGAVMARTFKACLIMAVIYAIFALLYTYVLFPNFAA